MDLAICLVTCPSSEVALGLAKSLVDARLAACVQVIPAIKSVYRWKADICIDEESLLVIKTRRQAVAALKQSVLTNHPYETPQFVVIDPSDASSGYLRWVIDSVSDAAAGGAEEVVVAAEAAKSRHDIPDHQE
jgi:periplasmic divalent cation tolerance protein